MKFFRTLLVFNVLLFAACGASQAPQSIPVSQVTAQATTSVVQPGDYQKSLTVVTDPREYILHVPTGYDGTKALPVVLLFHGHGGNAKGFLDGIHMVQKSDQGNFILVSMQALGSPSQWNTGLGMPGNAADDVGFTRAVVQQLQTDLKVDDTRIYAVGFSNGAFMVNRLAAEMSDVFASVASVEGAVGVVSDDGSVETVAKPKGPIPILFIHGVKDDVVPFEGGLSASQQHNLVSVEDSIQFWAFNNGCSMDDPDQKVAPGGAGELFTLKNCVSNGQVALVKLEQGKHQWPTLVNDGNIDGTDTVLNFFFKHPKGI